MENSTHKCEVVEVNLIPIEGADKITLCRIFDGYTCVTQKEQWKDKSLGIYIPPDSLVDVTRPEFDFLTKDAKNGFARIKAKKIRGYLSFGLLVPAPSEAILGEDWAEKLGVKHYDQEEAKIRSNKGVKGLNNGETAKAPSIYCPKYDLETGRKYAKSCFTEGEPVFIHEKVNGENWLGVSLEDGIHIRSRTTWKKEYPTLPDLTADILREQNPLITDERINDILTKLELKKKNPPKSKWWQALDDTPNLREFLIKNPRIGIFGELINTKGGFNYGVSAGKVKVFPFDLMRKDGSYFHAENFVCEMDYWRIETPYCFNYKDGKFDEIPFNQVEIEKLAEGKTMHKGASHLREGVVVTSWNERINDKGYRCKLKWVGAGYLEKSTDDEECVEDEICLSV